MTANGGRPAEDFYWRMTPKARSEIDALFVQFADSGSTKRWRPDKVSFITDHDLIELKGWGVRFIGQYRPGKRFVIACGLEKRKNGKLRPKEFERAKQILKEDDERRQQDEPQRRR